MIRLPLYPEDYKLEIEGLPRPELTKECTKCPESLRAGIRTVCMQPEGDPGGVLFLGDYPSKEDDRSRKPLTASVRYELDAILERAKYKGPVAYDVALRCNPPGEWEKKDFKTWIENCKPYLATSFHELAPKRVICLGPHAAAAILGRVVDTYSSRRGVAWIGDVAVFWTPTYDRAAVNRFFMDRFRADIQWALTVDLAKLPRPPKDGYCLVVESVEDAEAAEADLRALAEGFAFDVETAGQMYDPIFRIACTSMSPVGKNYAWVWPETVLTNPYVYAVFKRLLEDPDLPKSGQNGKFDIKAVRSKYGLRVRGYRHDTHLQRRALYSDAKADLGTVGELVGMGGHKKELRAELLRQRKRISDTRKKVKDGKLDLDMIEEPLIRRACEKTKLKADAFAYGLIARVAPELLWRYNAMDAISTGRGVLKNWPEIQAAVHPECKGNDLAQHYDRLVTKLTDTMVQIEDWGMPMSLERIMAADALVLEKLQAVEAKIQAMKPGINPRSGPQLIAYVFGELKLPPQKSIKKKKTEAPGLDAAALKGLKDMHPFISLLMEFRKLDKLRGTYTLGLQQFRSPDGRVHPWLKPGGTKTGRLSSEEPNCFDGETEVLTAQGWVRFDQYLPGMPVMQWNEDNTLELVKPKAYIQTRQEVLHISTRAIDLAVTPNHRCLLFDHDGTPHTMLARDYKENYVQRHAARFKWPGAVELSQAQIGLICAVQADGKLEFENRDTPAICFGFKKPRKIERLGAILKCLGVAYNESLCADGVTYFRVNQADVPLWLWTYVSKNESKHFGPWLLQLSRQGAEWFAEEVFQWDGLSTRKTNYSSNEYTNCSWVQTVMVLLNKRSKLRAYAAASGNTNWQVDICHHRDSSWTTNHKVKSLGERDVYCVSVPSGAILVRRNGRCAITHQCQNIGGGKEEADKAMGKMIKDIFVASPGHVLLQLDYSQLELRVAALLCGDEKMREIFLSGQDYHMATARLVAPVAWGITADQVTKAHRSMVKAVVFGLLYGMTDAGLAMRLGITTEQAAKLRIAIFGGFPKLYSWYSRFHRYATERGMCLTYWKGQPARRRPLLDIADCTGKTRWDGTEVLSAGKRKALNAAINTPVQGTASDFMLMSLVQIVDAIVANNWPAKVIMSVHDSAIIEVREDFAEQMAKFARDIMESQGWGDVPIVVDVEKGYSWGSMEKWEPEKSRKLTVKAAAANDAGKREEAIELYKKAIDLDDWNKVAAAALATLQEAA